MNIIITWWSWKDGENRKMIRLPSIKKGYISKKAWLQFESDLKALNGKKVRITIKEDM
jgi:hypothetical protein